MQKLLPLLALFTFLCTSVSAQQAFEQNPQTFSVNRLPAHATLYHYQSEAMAKTGGRLAGRTPLNGTWDFKLLPNSLGKSDAYPTLDAGGFSPIQVPGNWEMQGHGMRIYTNWEYPFRPAAPPFVPAGD